MKSPSKKLEIIYDNKGEIAEWENCIYALESSGLTGGEIMRRVFAKIWQPRGRERGWPR